MTHKLARQILALALAFATTHVAFGILQWEDYDYDPTYLSENGQASYTGQFKITPGVDTFDPAKHFITSARARFSFSDGYNRGDRGTEYVDIFMDSEKLLNNREVDGTHTGGFDWISKGLTGSMISSLSSDGIIDYTITIQDLRGDPVWVSPTWIPATTKREWSWRKGWHTVTVPGYWKRGYWKDEWKWEDTWFKEAHLIVKGDFKAVPDAGATALLLTLGIGSMVALRKRAARR